jgi:hypothetical protein|tara:strand:+ start:802 stop:1011 length:210 start_codon:yes stop_codon:yes gene_type:complete
MDNYVDKAIDEVYDILLYNPTYIDKSTKKRVLKKMMDHYLEVEEYEKCKHVQELMDMLERTNENSSKKS